MVLFVLACAGPTAVDTDADGALGDTDLPIETCNGADDDGDGLVDADDPDVSGALSFWADADGDGYGSTRILVCEEVPGLADEGGDCDDGSAAFHPHAEENCDDPDYDCDGYARSCAAPDWEPDAMFTGQHGGDGVGTALAAAGDVDGDGLDDVLVGSKDAIYLVLGSAEPADRKVSHADGGYLAPDAFPSSFAGLGDMNGDGYADLAFGVPGDGPDGAANTGSVLVILGGPGVTLDLAAPAARLVGEPGDAAAVVARAGDVDGDGLADLLVGAPGNGRARLVLGRSSLTDLDPAASDARYTGTAEGRFGYTMAAAGDADGDGLGDLVLAAPADGPGVVYLVLGGGPLGDVALEDTIRWTGRSDDQSFGVSVAGAGDVDGDGFGDVLLASNGEPYSDSWQAFLMRGATAPPSATMDDAAGRFYGDRERHGSAAPRVSGAGDTDGDGHADLVFGCPDDGDEPIGAAYLVLGSTELGVRSLYYSADGMFRYGRDLGAGSAVAGVGDFDGNGLADVLVGEPGEDHHTSGTAFLFLGPS